MPKPVLDKRAYQLESLIKSLMVGQRGGVNPTSNAFGTGSLHNLDLGVEPQICFGRIVESIGYVRFYKVQVERRNTTLPCCDLVHSGLLPVGTRSLQTYPPGTSVIVIIHPRAYFGIIIGSIPDVTIDPRHALSDYIVQGSNVGLTVDTVHKFPLTLGGITDWSAFRPFDSLSIGEYGGITETGLSIFMDPFMAFMRVDEATGLVMFYWDQLLRLSGYNLQIRSSGHEREDLDDESEYSSYEGFATYVWENRGAYDEATEIFREIDVQTRQQEQPYYAKYEPSFDNQQSIHRLQRFHGYLGQAERTVLHLLPENHSDDVATFAEELIYPGVYEENLALHGRKTIASAKGIILTKRVLIPTPKRMKRPEDKTGDTADDYSSAGLFGPSSPDHKPVSELEMPVDSDDVEPLVRTAGILDQLAYLFNFEGVHPFFYHQKDWYIPEQDEMSPNDVLAEVPDFNSLSSTQFLQPPAAIPINIDHRYGNAMYFPNQSYIAIMDDGSILVGDGFGSELNFTMGQGFIDVPGDLWLRSGRNIILKAGKDVIIEANKSIDLTTSQKDIRLKAEQNLMMLGGNNGCGGVLIENRGECPAFDWNKVGEEASFTGIILKSRDSPIVCMTGSKLILSTNVMKYVGPVISSTQAPDDNANEYRGGPILIDAGPESKILTYSKSFERRTEAAIDIFYDSNGNTASTEFRKTQAFMCMPLKVAKSIASGDKIVSKSLLSANQNASVNSILNDIQKRCEDLVAYADATHNDGRLIFQDSPFSDVRGACFSLRTALQYKTSSSFVLYECRWQQMARLSGISLESWSEPVVTVDLQTATDNRETYPYPGRLPLTVESNLYQQDLTLFDIDNQRDKDRGLPGSSDYEEPSYGDISKSIIDGNYLIIP